MIYSNPAGSSRDHETLPQPDSSPGDVREARRWLLLERLQELAQLLASYGISLCEAAYRGSDVTITVHVKQMRLAMLDALGVAKELRSIAEEAGL